MQRYLAPFVEPVGAAAAVFPLLALLTLLPFALLHYRRHGRVHPWRALVAYSFVFYLLAAVFLVSLPLPDRPEAAEVAAWLDRHSRVAEPRLDPLAFVADAALAPPGTARNRAVLQAVFNGVLLFPFGFYLVYAFRKRVWGAWLGGWVFSLLLELSQLTGLFWMYPGPYRLFDAGDLLLNSTGSLAGGLAALLLLKLRILPDLAGLKDPDTPWIGSFRRGIALAVDLAAASVTAALALFIVEGVPLPPEWGPPLAAAAFGLWLILVPALDAGQGPGRRITLCAIRNQKGSRARIGRLLARQSLLWGPPLATLGLAELPGIQPLLFLLLLGWAAGGLVNLAGSVFSKEHAGWIDRRFGTRVRNTWVRAGRPAT